MVARQARKNIILSSLEARQASLSLLARKTSIMSSLRQVRHWATATVAKVQGAVVCKKMFRLIFVMPFFHAQSVIHHNFFAFSLHCRQSTALSKYIGVITYRTTMGLNKRDMGHHTSPTYMP